MQGKNCEEKVGDKETEEVVPDVLEQESLDIEAEDAPVEVTANESALKPDEVPKEKELTGSTERVESLEDSGVERKMLLLLVMVILMINFR